MTQAAGGVCCASRYSDVKHEAQPCDLVLRPEVRAPLAGKARLLPGACSWNLGEGCFMWVLRGLNRLGGPHSTRIRMAMPTLWGAFTKEGRLDGLIGATVMSKVWR